MDITKWSSLMDPTIKMVMEQMPYFKFPPAWEIKIIPNFGGSDARFLVKNGEDRISVYLDIGNKLGVYGQPYWEVYPVKYAEYKDTARFSFTDISGLLACIQTQLDNQVYEG